MWFIGYGMAVLTLNLQSRRDRTGIFFKTAFVQTDLLTPGDCNISIGLVYNLSKWFVS